MEPVLTALLLIVIVAAVAGSAGVIQKQAPRALNPGLVRVAKLLDFAPPAPESTVIGGTIKGTWVHVEGSLGSDDDPPYLDVRLELSAPLHFKLRAVGEGLLPSFDYKTGDDAFDRDVKLAGPKDELAGLLSAEVRAVLAQCVGYQGFSLSGDGIRARMPRFLIQPGQAAAGILQLVELARLIESRPTLIPNQLLDVVQRDWSVDVRRSCAELLSHNHVGSDAAASLPRVLMESDELGLQLMGANLAPAWDPVAQRILERNRGPGGRLSVLEDEDPEAAGRLSEVQWGGLSEPEEPDGDG